ncbi:alpha/beta hydrolase-fold protein [Flavivirga aquimarina]|uniref:Alpha/beta hydrolase-fold protein n=1 Tax=Flavivirga aquimarina TaxID=2027862 RepID=A0ABT8W6H4_9FLAO|nr:alpha/beta hydrolase-fold protein [Flavivirga aquimarina]MDO5968700.1 alpha/beta hydrolase-fold protein [Flavivirga aquimarina]
MKKVIVLFLCLIAQLQFSQTIYSEGAFSIHNLKEKEQSFYVQNTTAHVYTDSNGTKMPYRLFLPPNYNPKKKYPLLLSFHGAGSRGNDNVKQLRSWVAGWMDEKVQKENPCIILMPQCPVKQKWVNVPWKKGSYSIDSIPLSTPMKLAKEIFDKVIHENAVDKNRIYVTGVSMGGYAAWNFLMRYHEQIAAAIPICGAGDPSMANKISKIPIWAFHGDKDPTVPLSGSTDMIESLYNQKNNKARLTVYKNVGHNSYELAWKEAKLIDWVFSQKKTVAELDIAKKIKPLKKEGVFRDSLYYNWGGSIIKEQCGKYHLFYSRWKRKYTFNGWLTFSEIAHAVSTNSTGPWEYKETVLKGRGKGNWDEITAHNPKIKYFNGQYYLYYIATNLNGEEYTHQDLVALSTKSLKNKDRGTLRKNQRTGVAVSNSINGPWKRMDKALIEPSGPIETIAVNPAICQGKDDRYYLIIKGDKPDEKRFVRNQAIAVSKTPEGPFAIHTNPVIGNLDTEDVSMWYDNEQSVFYAVFHAHSYIGLMTSSDGLNWGKAKHYHITDKKILLEDGSFLTPGRMERPFVYTENNQPKTLCLAIKKGNDSYTIFIPLKENN